MRLSQKNKGLSSFVEIVDYEIISDYRLKMIKNNKMRYILEPYTYQMDERTHLLYKTDGFVSARSHFKNRPPAAADVQRLLTDLCNTMKEISEYLLDIEDVVLDLSNIYFKKESDRYCFIYIPSLGRSFVAELRKLLEDIMVLYDHTNNTDIVFLYKLYSNLILEGFAANQLPSIIKKCINEKEDVYGNVTNDNFYAVATIEKTNEVVTEAQEDKEEKEEKKNIIKGRTAFVRILTAMLGVTGSLIIYYFFGEYSYKFIVLIMIVCAVIIFAAGSKDSEQLEVDRIMAEYCLSSDEMQGAAGNGLEKTTKQGVFKLVSSELKYPPYIIKEGDNYIGRTQRSNMDICLVSDAISRRHAVMHLEGESLFVTDNGSTNGTYINSKRLGQYESCYLKAGDVIGFATEEFYLVKD